MAIRHKNKVEYFIFILLLFFSPKSCFFYHAASLDTKAEGDCRIEGGRMVKEGDFEAEKKHSSLFLLTFSSVSIGVFQCKTGYR